LLKIAIAHFTKLVAGVDGATRITEIPIAVISRMTESSRVSLADMNWIVTTERLIRQPELDVNLPCPVLGIVPYASPALPIVYKPPTEIAHLANDPAISLGQVSSVATDGAFVHKIRKCIDPMILQVKPLGAIVGRVRELYR
jgi:hypothetical protein